MPLFWDFLWSTLTKPSKELHISPTPGFGESCTGKLDFSPAGLGFRHRGAPEHRDGTKSKELAYHVFKSALRVVHAKY